MEITTYEDLANAILALPVEQRRQPVQVAKYTIDSDEVVELLPSVALATVGELEIAACRSVHDNKWHADDVVLLVDCNPFSEDGAIGYDLTHWSGELPIYPLKGPTTPDEQKAASDRMVLASDCVVGRCYQHPNIGTECVLRCIAATDPTKANSMLVTAADGPTLQYDTGETVQFANSITLQPMPDDYVFVPRPAIPPRPDADAHEPNVTFVRKSY